MDCEDSTSIVRLNLDGEQIAKISCKRVVLHKP